MHIGLCLHCVASNFINHIALAAIKLVQNENIIIFNISVYMIMLFILLKYLM